MRMKSTPTKPTFLRMNSRKSRTRQDSITELLHNRWTVRAMLFILLLLGLAGTGVELLLLGHDEDLLQLVPLVLIAVGLVVVIWHMVAQSRSSLRVMRGTMVLFIAGGILGILLHYRGSAEFQKEIDPSIAGVALFTKAIQSKAPPALAPSAMAWFGLLGLAWTSASSKGPRGGTG
jgi:uncharacterized membrane protein